jgi:hypothetical protein
MPEAETESITSVISRSAATVQAAAESHAGEAGSAAAAGEAASPLVQGPVVAMSMAAAAHFPEGLTSLLPPSPAAAPGGTVAAAALPVAGSISGLAAPSSRSDTSEAASGGSGGGSGSDAAKPDFAKMVWAVRAASLDRSLPSYTIGCWPLVSAAADDIEEIIHQCLYKCAAHGLIPTALQADGESCTRRFWNSVGLAVTSIAALRECKTGIMMFNPYNGLPLYLMGEFGHSAKNCRNALKNSDLAKDPAQRVRQTAAAGKPQAPGTATAAGSSPAAPGTAAAAGSSPAAPGTAAAAGLWPAAPASGAATVTGSGPDAGRGKRRNREATGKRPSGKAMVVWLVPTPVAAAYHAKGEVVPNNVPLHVQARPSDPGAVAHSVTWAHIRFLYNDYCKSSMLCAAPGLTQRVVDVKGADAQRETLVWAVFDETVLAAMKTVSPALAQEAAGTIWFLQLMNRYVDAMRNALPLDRTNGTHQNIAKEVRACLRGGGW